MDGSNALGRFLRGRRERLSPADVGLPTTGRRRVRGLRREEVSGLAGISPDYYLRIEQGRDVNPSPQVLESLAQALRLTTAEREHLLLLARYRDDSSAPDAVDAVPVGVSELLDAIEPLPAFAQNRFMDVLAANVSARNLSPAMRPGTNLIESAFLNDWDRTAYEDWETVAEDAVGHLRSLAGPDVDSPRFRELTRHLSEQNADFRRLWNRFEVRPQSQGRRVINHPEVGRLELSFLKLALPDPTHIQVVVYYPTPGSGTEVAMERLARERGAES